MAATNHVRASPGFFILLGLLFYLDEGLGLLGWGLLACLLHELGHVAAIHCLGGRVSHLELSAVGANLCLDASRPLSYEQELSATLAGPVASLLTALFALRWKLFLLAGLSLGQGFFNLLPLLPLDGGRFFYLLLASQFGEELADQVLGITSAILSGLLVGVGLILTKAFGNPTLLFTAIWLALGALKQIRRYAVPTEN